MTSTISKYFGSKTTSGGKRKQLSTSSASDSCVSPESGKVNQDRKKQRHDSDSESEEREEMASQNALEEIREKLEVLASAKDDIKQIKQDMEKLTQSLIAKIEKLESAVFDLESGKDKLKDDIVKLKENNKNLHDQLEQEKKSSVNLKLAVNDQEQHGRLWNVRVHGVKEEGQGQTETVEDCIKKCTALFSHQVGVPVSPADIEIAHRTGRPGTNGKPRPIIVRFFSRQKKRSVLASRRKLKHSGVSISEDLTRPNLILLKKANEHSASLAVWSSNGKILAKMKNGKLIKVDINTNIDEEFAKAMRY